MQKMKVGFVHPDLGIGGAERLVVDTATLLKRRLNFQVTMYTSHHDANHSFAETNDGTLPVVVVGDFLPRSVLGGRFHVLFAMMKAVLLAIYLVWIRADVDVFVVDQVSTGVPILRLLGKPILFYCHFPDKLLSKRSSAAKMLYRWPIDLLEELSTGMADGIVVNSDFTGDVFQRHFPRLQHYRPPVLYPCIQLSSYNSSVDLKDVKVQQLVSNIKPMTLLSINRFERKKNIGLAIVAFAKFLRLLPEAQQVQGKKCPYRLIVAGGYDSRVAENVEYHRELAKLCGEHKLTHYTLDLKRFANTSPSAKGADVLFVLSFSDNQRAYLLGNSSVLLYTPSNEHFGIVPLEAMYAGLPVLAVNSGGPKETVLDGVTGYLCDDNSDAFCAGLEKVLVPTTSPTDVELATQKRLHKMSEDAKEHVLKNFSDEKFLSKLTAILEQLRTKGSLPSAKKPKVAPKVRFQVSDKLLTLLVSSFIIGFYTFRLASSSLQS